MAVERTAEVPEKRTYRRGSHVEIHKKPGGHQVIGHYHQPDGGSYHQPAEKVFGDGEHHSAFAHAARHLGHHDLADHIQSFVHEPAAEEAEEMPE
jgi:hypothetical protein